MPPSALSPIGIVRHLTDVEAYWLREVLLDEEQPDPHCTDDNPHGDFDDVDPATALADIEAYREELVATRTSQASWSDLDGSVRGLRHGKSVNLRWILTHLIEEYARHLGHLDLLREAIDGRTGTEAAPGAEPVADTGRHARHLCAAAALRTAASRPALAGHPDPPGDGRCSRAGGARDPQP